MEEDTFNLFETDKKETGLEVYKVTESDYNLTYQTYPELTADPLRKCPSCSRPPMRCDVSCIRHTRKSLKTYDIPWMCTAIKGNGKRCTHIVIEGKTLCAMHYKKEDKPSLSRTKMTKQYLHQAAMISPNPEDWKNLIAWSCATPKDLVKVLEETLNRYRYGSINKEQVLTIASLAKRILEIMTIAKEAGLDDKIAEVSERKWESDVHKIVSFKDRLAKMAQQREITILQPEEGAENERES